ncbi:hypothetical protein FDP41_009885 [Naegleria fowleri]|uniref:Uncharacterized protein n=1 Tax=Naegleria fowleri TaxID=5763 RepID=A0A6A5B8W0_NAEFO|nr:uncharacterized protein FDP41_009885 [Naegleria fowleri]KAF0971662.1 hypothetical protein FDP41_009885 [Naegleria fowleri]
MSTTPVIVRRISNSANSINHNNNTSPSSTNSSSPSLANNNNGNAVNSSPGVATRPRVMRVLSKPSSTSDTSSPSATTHTSTTTTTNSTTTTTTTPFTSPSSTDPTNDENSSSTIHHSSQTSNVAVKRVVKRLVVKKRVEGDSTSASLVSTQVERDHSGDSSTTNTSSTTTTTTNHTDAVTSQVHAEEVVTESNPKKSLLTTTTTTTNSNLSQPSSLQSSSNNNQTSSSMISNVSNHLSVESSPSAVTSESHEMSLNTSSSARQSISDLQSKFNNMNNHNNNNSSENITEQVQPQKRVVRVGVNRNSGKYGNIGEVQSNASPEVSNQEEFQSGVKVRRPTAPRINTGLVNNNNNNTNTNTTTSSTSSTILPSSPTVSTSECHSTNNSTTTTTDSPNSARRVHGIASMLAQNVKLMTPQQMQEQKQLENSKKNQDRLRPMRPNEILEWYGMDASIAFTHAKDDVKYDENSIEELKKQFPNISYTDYFHNPIYDEQLACEEIEIDMTPQEVLQYNYVVDLMKKKNPNLLTLDPILFEEEMRNASRRASLTIATKSVNAHFNNSSNQHSNQTESVTSTEDVLSREDVGFPIQKCSKNWRYQLKKKRDHSAKNSFKEDVASMTPRANAQLSPSSPVTSASTAAVNPLFDHLYYMPCWKHQIQLEQISKRLTLEEVKKI